MNRPVLTAAARGIVVAGVAGGLVYAAARTDASLDLTSFDGSGSTTSGSTVPATTARLAVENAELDCPGTGLAGVRGVDDIPTTVQVRASTAPEQAFSATSRPGVVAGAVTLTDLASGSELGTPVTKRAGVAVARVTAPDPARITADGRLAPGLVAAQFALVDEADARGLSALGCAGPSADAWLIAGTGEPGRQERIVLVNSGANPVVVDLTVHGRAGVVDAAGGAGVAVPARGRTTVLVDALAAGEKSPVVHVQTRGGFVQASLTDHWLDGLTPKGVDWTGPTAAPSERQVIPGVPGGGPVSVRVVNPGEGAATIQVRLLTSDGPRALPDGTGVEQVGPGQTADIVTDLPKGGFGLDVTADVPIVAAAMATSAVRPAVRDFAWAPSAPPLRGLSATVLGDVPDADQTLSLVATGGAAGARIFLVDRDGKVTERTMHVPADAILGLELSNATSVWVLRAGGAGDLRAGVVTSAPSGLTTRALTGTRVTARDVTVIPVVQ